MALVDDALVRRLVDEQFPEWRDLPLTRVEPSGTDNAIFRLGDELAVRMPRRPDATPENDKLHDWLPLLAPQLPVEVPLPVALGRGLSVVTWVVGETPIGQTIDADELVAFVRALQRCDTKDAPQPGAGRGNPLGDRDEYVQLALDQLDVPGARELWTRACAAPEWSRERVWLHADIDARNVLVRDGHLTGVIDWGCMGIGDPAVDLMAAFKLLDAAGRERFREALAIDEASWLRAEGWALSQALLALNFYTLETNATLVREAERWLAQLDL
ncbi:MAG TPA: aminoglycoside phosphotransferase family protein [Gaiellaceae bacterium]|nr:aminoglycoside phosphotransferase family protein [Gaiellaceae bacterium]